MVCSTLLGFNLTAMAADSLACAGEQDVKVVNLAKNISPESIQEIVNDVSATLVHTDGSVVQLETTITIEDVTQTPLRMLEAPSANTYQVRATSKVESDSDNKNDEGVSASIHLSMRWTDVPGPQNILESLWGSVDLSKGRIESSRVQYGDALRGGRTTKNLGTQTSFSLNLNSLETSPTAVYQVYFVGASFYLNVSVTPSIWD